LIGYSLSVNGADEFYDEIIPADLSNDARNVMRQAFGGCSGRSSSIITW
jgi:hypothetical protein